MQIIGLRTQPLDIHKPTNVDGVWQFEFTAESQGVFNITGDLDALAGLKQDCTGVPMILNLNEQPDVAPVICTSGSTQNIWFEAINNILD